MLEMDPEYLFPAIEVRTIYSYLTVKPAWSEQCAVQHVRSVGSSHQDDPFFARESIHLHQKLVQRVFSFIVSSLDAVATTGSTYGIDLIDKDDTGCLFSGLSE